MLKVNKKPYWAIFYCLHASLYASDFEISEVVTKILNVLWT